MRFGDLEGERLSVRSGMGTFITSFFFFFWLCPRHGESPGLGIEHTPWQGQSQILNLVGHQGTPCVWPLANILDDGPNSIISHFKVTFPPTRL